MTFNPGPTPPRGDYAYPTRYRLGAGRLAELPKFCGDLGIRRPLVVTDPGVSRTGWFGRVLEGLEKAGLAAAVFSEVRGNPTEQDVMGGVAAFRAGEHDGCVLLGGGSALDAGKCIALMAGHEGSLFDYEEAGGKWKRIDAKRIAKVIACPTTAGTGSEVARAAVITDRATHAKRILFHPALMPLYVVADPETTLGLPPAVTAATGMDALSHGFEAWCSPAYHPMADGIALEGMRLVRDNLLVCYRDGANLVARTHMMIAASMGATAFQKGLGLIHAMAHPLGARTDIHHGLSNAILFPYVMRFNRPAIEGRMEPLARYLDLPGRGYDAVLAWILELRRELGIPNALGGIASITVALAGELAPRALEDPSFRTNPRPAGEPEIRQLFADAIEGR